MLLKLSKWALILIGLLAVIGAIAATAPGVSAQESGNATGEHLTPGLTLVDYGKSGGEGYVTLRADTRQEVVVYDPTAVFRDGPVPQREIVLPPDTTRTVSIELGEFKDTQAIAVQHDDGQWANPVRVDRSFLSSVDWNGWHVGVAIVLTVGVVLAFWHFLPPIIRRMMGKKEGQLA